MKHLNLIAALLLTTATAAFAADPQPMPKPEPLDPAIAKAEIALLQANQGVRDAQDAAFRRQTQKNIDDVLKACGEPCAEPAPQPVEPQTK